MGSAGDSPAPVGDPPTGTAESNLGERLSPLTRSVGSIPSGESPDGTGGSPVLPMTIFKTRTEADRCSKQRQQNHDFRRERRIFATPAPQRRRSPHRCRKPPSLSEGRGACPTKCAAVWRR